jgi:hypothetical protein
MVTVVTHALSGSVSKCWKERISKKVNKYFISTVSVEVDFCVPFLP